MATDRRAITADAPAPRADAWLAAVFPDLTRSRIQQLIDGDLVRVNGAPVRRAAPVRAGDRFEIEVPEARPPVAQPEAMALDVLLEDADILVLNKPPGLVVHPAPGHASGTLVNALLHHCAGSLSGIGGTARPGIVHRLDRDTSGAMVVAKTDRAHQALVRQFQSRTVEKVYLALVRGAPRQAQGRVEAPIGRHPVHRQRMAVAGRGKPAVTDYAVRERFAEAALVECRIGTGRTHQIRVHLAHLGCPVLGDAVYGRAGGEAGRQMLHAFRLAFDHPATGGRVTATAPLTEDFETRLKELREAAVPAARRKERP